MVQVIVKNATTNHYAKYHDIQGVTHRYKSHRNISLYQLFTQDNDPKVARKAVAQIFIQKRTQVTSGGLQGYMELDSLTLRCDLEYSFITNEIYSPLWLRHCPYKLQH